MPNDSAPVALVPRSAQSQVVLVLEDLLERARSGQIISLMALLELPAGRHDIAWGGDADLIHQLGVASRLTHEINERLSRPPVA